MSQSHNRKDQPLHVLELDTKKQLRRDITDQVKRSVHLLTPKPRNNPVRTALPSSLPPSSPPSATASIHADLYPVLPDDLGSEFDDWIDTAAGALEADSHGSDPFGFFAVERKLKILKTQQDRKDLEVLPTPSKKRHQRRVDISSRICSHEDSERDALPSSPSPSKPLSLKEKERPKDPLAVQARARTIPALRLRSQRNTAKVLTMDAPATSSQNHPFPPKSPATSKKSIREKSVRTRSKKRVQRTTKSKININDEQDKKWDQERRVRLEYFNKLKNYQLQKENVYII